jgi:hypothetical protein
LILFSLFGDRIRQEQVVEILDQFDFPRRQAHARKPHEGIDVGPADRRQRKAVTALAPAQPVERVPDVAQRLRQRRALQLRFVFRAPGGAAGALQEALQRLAPADAVLVDGAEPEGGFRVRPQLLAEGGIKAASPLR